MQGATSGIRRLGPTFPPLVWMVLTGTLVTRTAFFMVWPFLAVILARQFHLSPAEIGGVIGSAFFASGFAGFYSGNLSDRFGRRAVMLVGCAGSAIAYAVLATATSVVGYVLGAFLVGLTQRTLEAPGNALIADVVDDHRTRHLAFHARYFLINVGGATGPLLGLVFGLSAKQPTFWITAGVYALFAVLLHLGFRRTPEHVHPDSKVHASLEAAVSVLARDHRFLLLVAANFLMMSAYAQQESTLIQYLNGAGGESAVSFVTVLFMTNALTIVLFQLPVLRLLEGYTLWVRTYLGLVFFSAGFVAYALLPVEGFAPWMLATWILSVGEVILFPTLQLQVDRMADVKLRGSYFGAAALGGMGLGAGPIVGGALLGRFGGPVTFMITAGVVALCGVCYRQSSRQERP